MEILCVGAVEVRIPFKMAGRCEITHLSQITILSQNYGDAQLSFTNAMASDISCLPVLIKMNCCFYAKNCIGSYIIDIWSESGWSKTADDNCPEFCVISII